MQSAFHNLPTVNGVMPAAGRAFAAGNVAHTAAPALAELQLDMAPAYPKAAGLTSRVRSVRLDRGKAVVVSDRFELAQPSRDVTLSLMTPSEVAEQGPGVLRLECGRVGGGAPLTMFAAFDSEALAGRTEVLELADTNLVHSWGDHLNRITLTARLPVREASWTLRLTPRGRS